MKYLKQFYKAFTYILFKSNMSLFDFFTITLLVSLANQVSMWFFLALLPMSILSAYLERVCVKN